MRPYVLVVETLNDVEDKKDSLYKDSILYSVEKLPNFFFGKTMSQK